MEGQEQAPKLLVQVRNVLRLHHYSIHTERSYVDWIKRYVHFHHMRCREDLADGERKIEAFLTDLAVRAFGGLRVESYLSSSDLRKPLSIRLCFSAAS